MAYSQQAAAANSPGGYRLKDPRPSQVNQPRDLREHLARNAENAAAAAASSSLGLDEANNQSFKNKSSSSNQKLERSRDTSETQLRVRRNSSESAKSSSTIKSSSGGRGGGGDDLGGLLSPRGGGHHPTAPQRSGSTTSLQPQEDGRVDGADDISECGSRPGTPLFDENPEGSLDEVSV